MMQKCKDLLLDNNINPISSIDYDINGEVHTLSLEWIIQAYLKTEKRDLFVSMLEKVVQGSKGDVETFFQQMGQLILMSSLSQNEIEG